jgi:cell division protein ZapA (FtsZ GTPase activity inhibitor)
MDDKLSIKVNVAERFYPLKIERKDEEKIRKAAKLINERVLQYKQNYPDKDIQDFLAMAALQFVIRMLDHENNQSGDNDMMDSLSEINSQIADFLSKSN